MAVGVVAPQEGAAGPPEKSSDLALGLPPERIPVRWAECLQLQPPLLRQGLHAPKSALEFRVRSPKSLLRVDVEVQAPVGDRKEQVAQLLGQPSLTAAFSLAVPGLGRPGRRTLGAAVPTRGQGLLDLAYLLEHLVAYLRGALPIEAYTRRAPSELRRPSERGQRARNVCERAAIARGHRAGGLRALARLLFLPDPRELSGIGRDVRVLKHVRVAPDQLLTNGACNRGEIEPALLLRQPRMKDHLEEKIAELIAKLPGLATLHGVGDFIGLLDRVGRNGVERLLPIPGAAALRIAQPRHQLEERRNRLSGFCAAAHKCPATQSL